MTPLPPWIIEELERRRQEREEQERPALHIVDDLPAQPRTKDGERSASRGPIVIEY
jgi:hypothetical protein